MKTANIEQITAALEILGSMDLVTYKAFITEQKSWQKNYKARQKELIAKDAKAFLTEALAEAGKNEAGEQNPVYVRVIAPSTANVVADEDGVKYVVGFVKSLRDKTFTVSTFEMSPGEGKTGPKNLSRSYECLADIVEAPTMATTTADVVTDEVSEADLF